MKTASFSTYQGPGRVSIARFAPRGTPGGFRIDKTLAPGPWFNSVTKDQYRDFYFGEVLGRLTPQQVNDRLHKLAGDAEPILLCWEKPTDVGTYCHRRMVAEWLEEKLGVKVPELGFEDQPHILT